MREREDEEETILNLILLRDLRQFFDDKRCSKITRKLFHKRQNEIEREREKVEKDNEDDNRSNKFMNCCRH